MKCKHEFKIGKALVNLATNDGRNTDMNQVRRGEGLYSHQSKARTVEVHKCIHCGYSIPLDREQFV